MILQALASLDRINWWHAWNVIVTPDESPITVTDGQASCTFDLKLAWVIVWHGVCEEKGRGGG